MYVCICMQWIWSSWMQIYLSTAPQITVQIFYYRLTDTHIYFHRSFIFIMEHKTCEVSYIYYVSSVLKQNILIWAYSCVDFMVLCLFTLFLSLALTISAKNFEEPSSNIISGSCCKQFHTSRLNISFSVYN